MVQRWAESKGILRDNTMVADWAEYLVASSGIARAAMWDAWWVVQWVDEKVAWWVVWWVAWKVVWKVV